MGTCKTYLLSDGIYCRARMGSWDKGDDGDIPNTQPVHVVHEELWRDNPSLLAGLHQCCSAGVSCAGSHAVRCPTGYLRVGANACSRSLLNGSELLVGGSLEPLAVELNHPDEDVGINRVDVDVVVDDGLSILV